MKKAVIITILVIVFLNISACSEKQDIESQDSDSFQIVTDVVTTSVTTSESHSIETIAQLDYEYKIRESYNLNKDIISDDKYFNVSEFELPEIDNIKDVYVTDLLNNENVFLLFSDDFYKDVEKGIYNIKTGEYETILSGDTKDYILRAYNDKYLIFNNDASDLSSGELYYYDFTTKELNKFYDYAIYENNRMYSYHANQILLNNDIVYFDDFYKNDDGEVAVKLYSYNIKTSELNIVKDNAQNPMLFNDEIICITNDNEEKKYNIISSVEGNYKRILNEHISGGSLKTCGDSIFGIEYDSFIDSKGYGYSNHALKNMISNDIIISTDDPICSLMVTDDFACWSDFAGTVESCPCMYDIKNDKIVMFDSLGEHQEYYIFPYEDCGVIMCQDYNNDVSQKKYYFFERK